MRGTQRAAWWRAITLGFVAVLVASCGPASWSQFHYGAGHAGFQPNETKIGVNNVGSLHEARVYVHGGTPPVVANGVLYTATTTLWAFDAKACTGGTSPCAPLWQSGAIGGAGGVAVANGKIYVTAGNRLYAYDTTPSGCNTATIPKTCPYSWQSTFLFFQ